MRLNRTALDPSICRGCDEVILQGWDHERCAVWVRLDPHALTPLGEVWALQDWRSTYERRGSLLRLRSSFNIPGNPPSVDRVVLTQHKCGEPVPDKYRLFIPPVPAPVHQHSHEIPF